MKRNTFPFRLLLLAAASLLASIPTLAKKVEIDGIFYELDSQTKTACVTYTGDTYYSKNSYKDAITIPSIVVYGGDGDNCTYTVTSIGDNAFHGCEELESITIPHSVTSIGEFAFLACYKLINIIIPPSVTNIGQGAFISTAWYDNLPEGVVYAGKVAYTYKGIMPENTTITLKDGTLSIDDFSFYFRTELVGITIPNSVIHIGDNAFGNCNGLTSITIGNCVRTIGSFAFSGCDNLASCTIPASVTSIGYGAFGSTEIQNRKLRNIICLSTNPESYNADSSIFGARNMATTYLHVPVGSKNAYKALRPWSSCLRIVEDAEEYTSVTPATLLPTEDPAKAYDLQGRRLTTPQRGGVYIQGGRKVLVK